MSKVVFLDPGHGGTDPGAIGYGIYEKNITLGIGSLTRQKLIDAGLSAHLTRSDDSSMTLTQRSTLANGYRADVFVSIHMNSYVTDSAHGIETLVKYPSASLEDKRLASILQQKLIAAFGLTNRGVKEQSLGVLREATMPCCLVEIGFISNPRENALITGTSGQEKAASALAEGIMEYLGVEPAKPAAPDVRVMIDGKLVDTYAKIEDGRTLVHVRFAEHLGYQVEWIETERLVRLKKV